MKYLKRLLRYREVIKYGIIGCFCAGLDFVVYSILTQLFHISYLYANIGGIHCGIFTSFFLNRHFTFHVKNKTTLRFISFYLVGLAGLLVSSGLLYLCIEKMQLHELIAKAITIVV
ncbi:MAG: GtrA family protein, partial [Bacteroidales bacterium]|nr:GtrA family protein [Bacteroidales bacterium]